MKKQKLEIYKTIIIGVSISIVIFFFIYMFLFSKQIAMYIYVIVSILPFLIGFLTENKGHGFFLMIIISIFIWETYSYFVWSNNNADKIFLKFIKYNIDHYQLNGTILFVFCSVCAIVYLFFVFINGFLSDKFGH